MGIGGFIARTAAVAAGNVAATYAVRGIDSAVDGRHARQADALPAVMAELTEHFIQHNYLPTDAEAKAQALCGTATERLRASGYLGRGPAGDLVIRHHEDYCRALMELEGVHVAEIRQWWDINEYWREVNILLKEEEHAAAMQAALGQGWSSNEASLLAWKLVPVYGQPHLRKDRDPDCSPLPVELFPRVEEYLGSNAHPFAEVSLSDAAQRPSLNGWIRRHVTLVEAASPSMGSSQHQLPQV